MNKILFSKKSDDWATPKTLYNKYMNMGYFDPCPLYSTVDGLNIEWGELNFINPPYSKIKQFVEKSIKEHKKGKECILLIPARTDTKYFRQLVDYGCEITFITGRLHFNNSDSAPFPSCIIRLTNKETECVWRDRKEGE